MTKEEWNKVINDILLQVKPIKLRTEIADRFFNILNEKEKRIAELERENEQLKEEVEILHKALELADRQLYGISSDDLIEQAKEVLK